jgi:hypothetical protein
MGAQQHEHECEIAARVAFAGVLEAHGLDPRLAEVTVARRGDAVRVELVPSGPVPAAIRQVASVRVAGAIRALDRRWRTIDVGAAAG